MTSRKLVPTLRSANHTSGWTPPPQGMDFFHPGGSRRPDATYSGATVAPERIGEERKPLTIR